MRTAILLSMAQSLGVFVIYLIIAFLLPAIKTLRIFDPSYIVDEDDLLTYCLWVNLFQAAIAFVAIVIIMEKINV